MKHKLTKLFFRLGSWAASAALIVALGNTGRSCWFLLHQLDVPEELKQ